MKTTRSTTQWLGWIMACGALTFAGPAQAGEMLNFARRASWPGYQLGNVMGMHATGSTVWLGIDCYMASIGSLIVLDVSNPDSPVVLSSTPTGGGEAWAFENGFAYAASSSSTGSYLEVYDLSDPRKPVRRGRVSILPVSGSGMTSMMAHQGYLWVFTDGGVETYDVRNPSAPQHAGSLLWADSQRPSPVYVCGDFAALMTTHYGSTPEYFLRVLDLKNPAKPTETDSMPFNIGNVGGWPFLVLTSLNDYLYYVTGSESGEMNQGHLHVARITSLGKLEPTAVDLQLTSSYGYRLWSVGDYLYFYGSTPQQANSYWLRVVDATDRLQPKVLASPVINTPTYGRDLVACNGRAFLSLGGIGGAQALFALDATNPAQPAALGTVWRNWGYQGRQYGLAGGSEEPMWRVQDAGTARIRLFGAAGLLQGNPSAYRDWNMPFLPGSGTASNPDVVHVILYSNFCYALSVGTVYYPESTARLDVFDLTAAGPPVYKGTTQLIEREEFWNMGYHTVKIDRDELYFTYVPNRLDVYSLSTPASPQFLSRASVGNADDLEIHNGYAYLFSAANGGAQSRWLEVVDVRDPANPSAATTFFQYSGVWHGTMTVDGDSLYVIYFKNGSPSTTVLDVFDLRNPLNPTRLSSTAVAQVTYSAYNDIAIQKPYAILAGPSLLVVDVSDPSHPASLGTYDPFPQLQNYTIGSFNQVKAWQNHVVIQNDTLGIEVIDVGVPLITRQPASRTNSIGTTASFNVEVSGGGLLSYQWRKDGTNLLDGVKFTGVTTTNLLIANVQLADAAGYSVVVTNTYGSVTSSVAQLTVTIPPNPGRFTRLAYSPEDGFSFIFRDATVGQPYRIQRSPSMAEGSWTNWQSFTYTEPTGFMDVGAAETTNKFYRAVSP